MSIVKGFKSAITEMALGKVDEKIDGREITRQLREPLDQQFGAKGSRRIRHERLWNFVKELAEGLFDGEILALRIALIQWAKELKPKTEV